MIIVNNTVLHIGEKVQAAPFDSSKNVRTGYSRLVRKVTNNPAPEQVSYTGTIILK